MTKLYIRQRTSYIHKILHTLREKTLTVLTRFGDTNVFKLLVMEIRPLFQDDRLINVPKGVDDDEPASPAGEPGGSSLSSPLSLSPFWPAAAGRGHVSHHVTVQKTSLGLVFESSLLSQQKRGRQEPIV